MVAAGGGGAGYERWNNGWTFYGQGGAGGGTQGSTGFGSINSNGDETKGAGATQTSGSAFGYATPFSSNSTGGGGGYYGGFAGSLYGGAGGGSSFISGYQGCDAIKSATDRTHTGQSIHYSGKKFVRSTMTENNNSGNGRVKITYIGESLP